MNRTINKENTATKEGARAYLHDSSLWRSQSSTTINTVTQAVDQWLDICETEGTDGQEPVTAYTLKTYGRRAAIMKSYDWPKPLQQLSTPDIVEFRSWLLRNYSKSQESIRLRFLNPSSLTKVPEFINVKNVSVNLNHTVVFDLSE